MQVWSKLSSESGVSGSLIYNKVCVVSKKQSVRTPEDIYCVRQELTEAACKSVRCLSHLKRNNFFKSILVSGCSESSERMWLFLMLLSERQFTKNPTHNSRIVTRDFGSIVQLQSRKSLTPVCENSYITYTCSLATMVHTFAVNFCNCESQKNSGLRSTIYSDICCVVR